MKKSLKWTLIAAVSVIVFIGIYLLYSSLKENYTPDPFSAQSQSSQASQADEYAAPDFTVLDENGETVKLSDYFGKPIVLNFWASWCYYCKEEMPDFNTAYHENPDIQFFMINVTDGNQETLDSAKSFIKEAGYDFPVFYDTELNAAITYGASGLPMTIFIDQNGNLITYANGMLSAETLNKGIALIKN